MNRQRLLWIAVVFAASVLAIASLLILWPSGPINRNVYKRIKQGMSEGEVRASLVVPPAHESTQYCMPDGKRLWWVGEQATIEVEFDDQGKVCFKLFHEEETPSLLQQLKSLWWTVRRMF
jgi:hypothetical protein